MALGIVACVATYARAPRLRRYGLYLAPALAGMLAKPPGLIFAPILVAYILLFDRRQAKSGLPDRREPLASCAIRAIPATVLALVFVRLEEVMTPASFVPYHGPALPYLITQPYVALRYFRSFFLPLYLSADTDLRAFDTPWNGPALAGFAFLALLIVVIVFAARAREWQPVAFGLSWFVLGLIPTSLYPLADVENDHRMFLPFVGLSIAAVWTAVLLLRQTGYWTRLSAAAVTAAILAAFAWGTFLRNEVWRTDGTLWGDVTRKSPNNPRGFMGYGAALLARGEVDLAYRSYQRAAALKPDDARLESSLGTVSGALCRDTEAASHFQRAIELAPHDAWSYIGYGRWLSARGDTALALQVYRNAYEQNAFTLLSSYGMMDALARQSEWEGLRGVVNDLLNLAPGDSMALAYSHLAANPAVEPSETERRASSQPSPQNYLDLSLIYDRAGLYEESIRAAKKVLELEPGSPWGRSQLVDAWSALSRKACLNR